MVPFKSCLMHDPQIPNFYLANLELGPLLDNFDGPVGPHGCVQSKSCIRQNVNHSWSPSILVLCTTPKFPTFILPTWNRAPFWGFCQARRASGVRRIKKLNKVDVHFLIVKNAYLHEPHTPPHPILREGSSKWQGSKYLFQQVVVGQVAAVEPELEGFGEGLLGPLLRSPVGPSAGQEGELIFPEESRHRLPQLKHEFNHHKVVVVAWRALVA